jgi:RNA polymerase sigma-70 factor (ECF subfamily)
VESDRELVLALRARQPGAFDRLYARHSDRIWRFLCHLAGAAADDLFQESWLAAARHVHRLREDTELLPWLFTIARNKQRNSLRALARKTRVGEALRAANRDLVAVDEQAHTRAEVERTQAAFDRLPAAHREVLLLCVVEHLETAAVARLLACSEAVVRKRLSRARQELARRCGRQAWPGGDP